MEMLIYDILPSCFPTPSPPSQGEADLNSSNSPRRTYFHFLCFLDEKMEIQRREMTCPRPHR